MQVIANGKIEADLPKIVEQLMEDAEDELLRHEELAGAGSSSSNLKFIQSVDDFPPVGSFPMPSDSNVGSVEVEILGDEFPSRAPHRVMAKLERRNKDKFVFHIEESQLLTSTDASVAVTDIEGLSVDAMPLDVEEFLQSVGKTLEVRNTARTFLGNVQLRFCNFLFRISYQLCRYKEWLLRAVDAFMFEFLMTHLNELCLRRRTQRRPTQRR